jgi:hypothetical protein
MIAKLRIKAQWFKGGGADKTPEQNASALAFIAWRVALNMLKRMREAGFDIDAGPAYFGFVREVLVFLLAGIDRMAYARLGPEGRAPFTTALVLRVADILRENEADLLGPVAGADHADRFIAQFNTLVEHYADFDWSDAEGPDFGFVRYLASRLEPGLPEKDRRWVVDQVMALEVPEAVGMLQRAMQGVFSAAPRRPRREAVSGD